MVVFWSIYIWAGRKLLDLPYSTSTISNRNCTPLLSDVATHMLVHKNIKLNSHKHPLSCIWIQFVCCKSHTFLLKEARPFHCRMRMWFHYAFQMRNNIYVVNSLAAAYSHSHKMMFHCRFITLLWPVCHKADEKCNKNWSECNISVLCVSVSKNKNKRKNSNYCNAKLHCLYSLGACIVD